MLKNWLKNSKIEKNQNLEGISQKLNECVTKPTLPNAVTLYEKRLSPMEDTRISRSPRRPKFNLFLCCLS